MSSAAPTPPLDDSHLTRAAQHKVAGVCAGVAERWHLDPLVVRVAAVLLAALGAGLGGALYVAAWALLPVKNSHAEAPLFRVIPAARRVPRLGWIAIIGVFTVAVMTTVGPLLPFTFTPIVVIAAAWYLFAHRPAQRRRLAAEQRQNFPGAAEPVGLSADLPPTSPMGHPWASPSAATYHSAPECEAKPPRARLVQWLGFGGAAAVVLALALVDFYTVVPIPPGAYFAAALLIVGCAVVCSAWMGRPRGLVPLGVVLLILSLMASTIAPYDADERWDYQRTYDATTLPERDRFDMGSAQVDLSQVVITSDQTYQVSMETGSIQVIVPEDTNVVVETKVSAGSMTIFDSTKEQGVELVNVTTRDADAANAATLRIVIQVSAGRVEVRTP